MTELQKKLKALDDSFKVIAEESLKSGQEAWRYLEDLIKTGDRNNATAVLRAVESVVSEEDEFKKEKRKYHLIRNSIIEGYELKEKEIHQEVS